MFSCLFKYQLNDPLSGRILSISNLPTFIPFPYTHQPRYNLRSSDKRKDIQKKINEAIPTAADIATTNPYVVEEPLLVPHLNSDPLSSHTSSRLQKASHWAENGIAFGTVTLCSQAQLQVVGPPSHESSKLSPAG